MVVDCMQQHTTVDLQTLFLITTEQDFEVEIHALTSSMLWMIDRENVLVIE